MFVFVVRSGWGVLGVLVGGLRGGATVVLVGRSNWGVLGVLVSVVLVFGTGLCARIDGQHGSVWRTSLWVRVGVGCQSLRHCGCRVA